MSPDVPVPEPVPPSSPDPQPDDPKPQLPPWQDDSGRPVVPVELPGKPHAPERVQVRALKAHCAVRWMS